jgi:RimJ/RimL family protein N-acetyltransferase
MVGVSLQQLAVGDGVVALRPGVAARLQALESLDRERVGPERVDGAVDDRVRQLRGMALVGGVERLAHRPVPLAGLVPPHRQHAAGAKRAAGDRCAALAIDPVPRLRGGDQVKGASVAAPPLEGPLVDLDGQPLAGAAHQLGHRMIGLESDHLEAAARELDGRLARPRAGLQRPLRAIHQREQIVVEGGRVAGAPALVQVRGLSEHPRPCALGRHGPNLAARPRCPADQLVRTGHRGGLDHPDDFTAEHADPRAEARQTPHVEIETERLLLRPLRLTDLDEFIALHDDPDVTRFIRRLERVDADERLRLAEREWRERGHGMFAVRDRVSGRFLGRAGLKYWSQFDETEVGWVLRRDAWGHGYATEAARACVAWGFASLEVPYLTAMIDPENEASIRLASRLGMSPLRRDILLGDPVVVFSLNRDNWSTTKEADG